MALKGESRVVLSIRLSTLWCFVIECWLFCNILFLSVMVFLCEALSCTFFGFVEVLE